jgi:hypothetical protein
MNKKPKLKVGSRMKNREKERKNTANWKLV